MNQITRRDEPTSHNIPRSLLYRRLVFADDSITSNAWRPAHERSLPATMIRPSFTLAAARTPRLASPPIGPRASSPLFQITEPSIPERPTANLFFPGRITSRCASEFRSANAIAVARLPTLADH